VLLIVTFQEEFDPPWIGQPPATTLAINRLAQREVDALIDRVMGNNPLPANIRQDIAERADVHRRPASRKGLVTVVGPSHGAPCPAIGPWPPRRGAVQESP
jgi:hypothetical protein